MPTGDRLAVFFFSSSVNGYYIASSRTHMKSSKFKNKNKIICSIVNSWYYTHVDISAVMACHVATLYRFAESQYTQITVLRMRVQII